MYTPIAIDDETKLHISSILKYYRSHMKIKQCDFIRYNGASVCSADTYSRIENGKIIKRNSIYIYLLYQIQATYDHYPPFWKEEQPKFTQLVRYLTMYQMEDFCTQCDEIKADMKYAKDFLAREIYELMDITKNFYNHHMSLEDNIFEKYIEIYEVFPASLQDVIKDMLYLNCLHHKRDLGLCMQIYQKLEIDNTNSAFLKIEKCREYILEERFLESHAVALQLEQQFLKDHNYQRLLDVYEIILMLYQKVQHPMHWDVYHHKFFDLVHEHASSFHPIKYTQSLCLYGFIQYFQKNYEDAYACFQNILEHNQNQSLISAIFLNIIASKMAEKEKSFLEFSFDTKTAPAYLLAFYQYYVKKHCIDDKEELESFLVKNVLPNIHTNDLILWEPLKEELLSLIKETKHYYIKKKLQMNEEE